MPGRDAPSVTSRAKRAIKVRIREARSGGRSAEAPNSLLGAENTASDFRVSDASMNVFESVAGVESDDPVFILSAGWRSGSTLLQRLVVSSGKVLVWGEPYSDASPLQNLMRMLPALDPEVFTEKWIIGKHPSDKALTDRFIANLFPPKESFAEAHRAFLGTLFGVSARDQNYERWGIKEVRWNAQHARYLRALYPAAHIVFLVRNPFDSFASYSGSEWYWNWPNERITTARQFGEKWAELASGFLDHADELEALLVTYEDLLGSPDSIASLENHLDLKFDRRVLGDNLGLSTRDEVGQEEIAELKDVVGPVAARFGYHS